MQPYRKAVIFEVRSHRGVGAQRQNRYFIKIYGRQL